MKSIFLLLYSDPGRNYSLNFKDQKEESLAKKKKADTSIQETGAIHVSSYTRNKEICANALNILPTDESFYTKRTIPTNVKKWKVVPAHSRDGGSLAIAVSEMVTRMMRHYDQDEREPDGSTHWDTIRSTLLKAFAKHGTQQFSDKFRFVPCS